MAPIYTGGLHSKKKGELQDIATSLRISIEGTREDLTQRIKKYLDDHPDLEDSTKFAGLYGRRKRSVPPPSLGVPKNTRTTSRSLPTLPETPPKRHLVVDLDGTPSSLPPLPPSEPNFSVVQRITAVMPTSTVNKLKNAISTRYEHAQVTENGSQILQTSRGFLSQAVNIWTLTALVDLALILYNIIPWKYAPLSSASYDSPLAEYSVPYPPASIFQAPAFWSVIMHWSLPSIIIPSIVGYLISFAPRTSEAPISCDPLTASIIRLATQLLWNFPSPKTFIASGHELQIITHKTNGLDVLGQQWRVVTAGITLLFAFAEQISNASTFSPAPSTHEIATDSISARYAIEEDLASEID